MNHELTGALTDQDCRDPHHENFIKFVTLPASQSLKSPFSNDEQPFDKILYPLMFQSAGDHLPIYAIKMNYDAGTNGGKGVIFICTAIQSRQYMGCFPKMACTSKLYPDYATPLYDLNAPDKNRMFNAFKKFVYTGVAKLREMALNGYLPGLLVNCNHARSRSPVAVLGKILALFVTLGSHILATYAKLTYNLCMYICFPCL